MPEPLAAPGGLRDPWGPVLDDLDRRVTAAEAGDLAALQGWAPPAAQPAPMNRDDEQRATGILTRQRTLMARMREQQRVLAASMRVMRRPQYRPLAAPPIYIDRLG